MSRGASRRQREIDRQRRQREKAAKREQRKLEKQERVAADLPSEIERSLEEIVPGPQPPDEEE